MAAGIMACDFLSDHWYQTTQRENGEGEEEKKEEEGSSSETKNTHTHTHTHFDSKEGHSVKDYDNAFFTT